MYDFKKTTAQHSYYSEMADESRRFCFLKKGKPQSVHPEKKKKKNELQRQLILQRPVSARV